MQVLKWFECRATPEDDLRCPNKLSVVETAITKFTASAMPSRRYSSRQLSPKVNILSQPDPSGSNHTFEDFGWRAEVFVALPPLIREKIPTRKNCLSGRETADRSSHAVRHARFKRTSAISHKTKHSVTGTTP
jgi:hypothetical protein